MLIFIGLLLVCIISILSFYFLQIRKQQKKLDEILLNRYGELEMIEIDTSIKYEED